MGGLARRASRQVFDGWVLWFAWDSNGNLLFIEGRPDLKGVLWRISPTGQRTVVLKEVAFLQEAGRRHLDRPIRHPSRRPPNRG